MMLPIEAIEVSESLALPLEHFLSLEPSTLYRNPNNNPKHPRLLSSCRLKSAILGEERKFYLKNFLLEFSNFSLIVTFF